MPSSSSAASDGTTLLQWQEISVHGFDYHYAMVFDGYDVCAGVTREYVG